MKKMMFTDKYGLTEAVLEGRKTMMRRICKIKNEMILADDVSSMLYYPDENVAEFLMKDSLINVAVAPYKIGEVVAVAQSYKSIEIEIHKQGLPLDLKDELRRSKGYKNKMCVRAELMPDQIKITDIKVERLQDISDEDCMREGIYMSDTFTKYGIRNGYSPQCANDPKEKKWWFNSPRDAFAALIDAVSGKGTWKSNPYIFAYSFEVVK